MVTQDWTQDIQHNLIITNHRYLNCGWGYLCTYTTLQVWRVAWNVTGTVLASSGDDGCVRLWKGRNVYCLIYMLGHS